MATVRIPASDIQEHLDNQGLNITAVSWNEFNGPEVEIDVKNDMEFEDDDLVDISEVVELKEEMVQLQKEFDEMAQDYTSLQVVYKEAVASLHVQECKYETLEADYNRFKQMMNKKTFSWSFWK